MPPSGIASTTLRIRFSTACLIWSQFTVHRRKFFSYFTVESYALKFYAVARQQKNFFEERMNVKKVFFQLTLSRER